MKYFGIISLIILLATSSCKQEVEFSANFDNINDRIWVGRDFWSVPLEDWKVENGKLHLIGSVPNSRVNLLTSVLSPETGDFELSAKINLTNKGKLPGSAGFLIGLHDKEDPSAKSACYFGEGIKAGVSLKGFAFLKDIKTDLPAGFDFDEFNISVKGSSNKLELNITDKNGLKVQELQCETEGLQGLIALSANVSVEENEKPGNSNFSFDDLKFSAPK
ncbi:hypothetical protein MASR2M47_22730 [Draconibacterium sp.]